MRVLIFIFLIVSGYANFDSIEKKIGRVFCVPACPNGGQDHREDLKILIKDYHVRAFLLKQGTLSQAKDLIAWLKETAKDSILIVADAEWGLSMRLSDAPSYPKNEELSQFALAEIYDVGKSIAKDCLDLGVHLNLAPVVDINLNPANPIIGKRSFGSDPKLVASNAFEIIKGMKDEGLAICLKHFPGHGDVEEDSHLSLPVSHKSIDQLYQEDLLPYIKLKKLKPDCVMVAHILFTKIDSIYPATLSSQIIKILKDIMGDEPLIISDALNMKALADIKDVPITAHLAGIDILLYGGHKKDEIDIILKRTVPDAITSLIEYYLNKDAPQKHLDRKVQKIKRLSTLNNHQLF